MSAQKTIVFDWNGTLFDDFDAMLKCNNIVFEKFGKPAATADAYREFYEVPFGTLLRNHGFSVEEVTTIDEQTKHIFHDHYEPHAELLGLRKGADEILRQAHARGIRNLILSNHLVAPIRAQLSRLKIEHLFSEVLAYSDRATQFRDTTKGEKLQRYMKHVALEPRQALIIGDSTEEIAIARDQGLISVAITGGCVSEARLRQARPDHLIHAMHELKSILEERGFLS